MKKFTIEVNHASPAQLTTIALELKIMSNAWEKFGPRIMINGKELQAPSRGSKHQAPSLKPQAIQAPSSKLQAPSSKLQAPKVLRRISEAPSRKLQAP